MTWHYLYRTDRNLSWIYMVFVFIAKVQHFVELYKLFHYYKQKKQPTHPNCCNLSKRWMHNVHSHSPPYDNNQPIKDGIGKAACWHQIKKTMNDIMKGYFPQYKALPFAWQKITFYNTKSYLMPQQQHFNICFVFISPQTTNTRHLASISLYFAFILAKQHNFPLWNGHSYPELMYSSSEAWPLIVMIILPL